MQTLMIAIAVGYLLVGLVVYAATDTIRLGRRLSSATWMDPSNVGQFVFVFVVALWPLWLGMLSLDKKGPV